MIYLPVYLHLVYLHLITTTAIKFIRDVMRSMMRRGLIIDKLRDNFFRTLIN